MMHDYQYRTERGFKLFGCAKRGCDKVNPDYLAFGSGDKTYCLDHKPWRARWRLWLQGH